MAANKKTLIDFPDLLKEWHPIKNDNLQPENIAFGSNVNRWWICDKGHEWEESPNRRTSRKSKCPYCFGRKVCLDNCLISTHPELAKEWHPVKNGNLRPEDFKYGSNFRVWWLCKENHEWDVPIYVRTTGEKRGCPYCSNRKTCNLNCLATTPPQLIKEWHPNNIITPYEVTAGSNKKILWQCLKKECEDHQWTTTVKSRTTQNKTGCPYCSNHKVCNSNCLATTHPQLIKEWHPNNIITPYEITAGSGRKIKWICNKGHEWISNANHRTNNRNCPICNESHGEKKIREFCENKNIKFKRQYKFKNCKYKNSLLFDFGIFVDCLKLIEYQGPHHYELSYFYNGDLELQKIRDEIKKKYCEDNNIPLLIIPYWEKENIDNLLSDFLGGINV